MARCRQSRHRSSLAAMLHSRRRCTHARTHACAYERSSGKDAGTDAIGTKERPQLAADYSGHKYRCRRWCACACAHAHDACMQARTRTHAREHLGPPAGSPTRMSTLRGSLLPVRARARACMHACARMHVCCVCARACMHACMRTCLCVCQCVCAARVGGTEVYALIDSIGTTTMCLVKCECMCACVCASVCACTHAMRMQACTRTHACTHGRIYEGARIGAWSAEH